MHMHKVSVESPEGTPKCLYGSHNSYLFTHLCGPSGKWWSLKTVLARQILYQILQDHSGTQFAEQNKESLLIVLMFDQQLLSTGVNQFIIVNTALRYVYQVNSKLFLSASHVAAFKIGVVPWSFFSVWWWQQMFVCVFSCKLFVCSLHTSPQLKTSNLNWSLILHLFFFFILLLVSWGQSSTTKWKACIDMEL